MKILENQRWTDSRDQKLYVHIEDKSRYVTLRSPALILKKFSHFKLDYSKLRPSFDDPMSANESAGQAG